MYGKESDSLSTNHPFIMKSTKKNQPPSNFISYLSFPFNPRILFTLYKRIKSNPGYVLFFWQFFQTIIEYFLIIFFRFSFFSPIFCFTLFFEKGYQILGNCIYVFFIWLLFRCYFSRFHFHFLPFIFTFIPFQFGRIYKNLSLYYFIFPRVFLLTFYLYSFHFKISFLFCFSFFWSVVYYVCVYFSFCLDVFERKKENK